jgi:hypothetical protein
MYSCTYQKKSSPQPVNTFIPSNRNSRHRELVNTPIKTDRKRGRIIMAIGMGMRDDDDDGV